MANEPTLGTIIAGTHVFPLRVYYEDTDAGGVVYYANYLRYAERARSEMLRAVGIEQRALAESDGIAFAVSRCEVDYLRPARLDDTLEVVTGNIELEGASLWVDQVIRRGAEELVRMRVRVACVGDDGRPARLPARLRTALAPLVKSNATLEKIRT